MPYEDLEYVENVLRSLDTSLDHIKEKSSLKWVVMIVSRLMEEHMIKRQSPKKLKQELVTWTDAKRTLVENEGTQEVEQTSQGGDDITTVDEGHSDARRMTGEDTSSTGEGGYGEDCVETGP